jgi:predicted PurR-regulated permease PerM
LADGTGEEVNVTFAQGVGFLTLLLALTTLWRIRQLLLLLFAAIIVANALNHFVIRLQRQRLPRGGAIAVAVTSLLGSLGLFIWLIIPPFLSQLRELVTLAPQGINQVIEQLKEIAAQTDPELIHALPNWQQLGQQLQPLLNQIAGQGLNIFYSTLGLPLSLLLLLVLSLMLLVNPQPYRRGFIRLFPAFYRHRLDQILSLCEASLEDWLIALLVNMGVVTALSFVSLFLLQVPLALALALIAGLFTFIPYIGPLISLIPAMAIALLDHPWKAVIILMIYTIIHQLESHWITPKVIPKPLPLLPGMILLAQVFFASLFGFLGLFLAVPLSVVSQVLLKEIFIKDILDQWRYSSPHADH